MMSAPKNFGEPMPEQQSNSSLSPMALLKGGLVRWRSAILLALICGASLAAAAYILYPAEYTTSAVIKFRFNDFLVSNENSNGGAGKEELENQQRTQIAFIKSSKVLDAASKSDARVLPVAKLSKDLKAGFSEGTPIMFVSLSGLDPEALAKSVNAITESFLVLAVEADRRELLDKSAQLDTAIRDSGNAILTKKTSLRNVTDSKTDDPKAKALEAEFLSNSIELTRTELEIEKRQGAVERAKVRLAGIEKMPIDRAALEDRLEQLPAVAEALATLGKLEAAESDIRSRLSQSDTPPVLKAADATKRQRELVQKLRADMVPKAEVQYRRQLRAELITAISKDEEELAGLKLAESILRKRRNTANITGSGLVPPEIEMQIKAIEQDEDVLKSMRTRRERLRIELQSGGAKATIFQPAEIPGFPNYRSQYIKTGMAGLAGLLLGWLAIGFWETKSRRVRDGRVLAAHTGLRILGAIPSGIPSGEGLLRPADLGLAVAADLLRTSLQLDERLRSRRTIVVTSATEGEGKSTLSLLLAGSFARAGFRTLLVDGDLRSPTLDRKLGILAKPGLSESLTLGLSGRNRSNSGNTEQIGEIEEIDGLPLGLIQAGAEGQLAASRLARADLRAWLASLRKNWEYIIIDTPPVLPVPDASFFSKAADGVVLCARAGVSRVEQVNASVDHINGLGIDCLGIVLNDVRGGRPSYYTSGRVEQISTVSPESIAASGIKS